VYEAGVGEGGRPPGLKNFRANSVFRALQVAQKFWMIKNISIQWKSPGQLYFLGKCKLLTTPDNKKYIFNTVKNSRATLLFRESASCSKLLIVKQRIFNKVKNFRETLSFRASASCSNIRDGTGQQFCSLARPELTWNCPARPVYAKLQHIFWSGPARGL